MAGARRGYAPDRLPAIDNRPAVRTPRCSRPASLHLVAGCVPHPRPFGVVGQIRPGINASAGKTKGNGSTGHGNRYLARVLGEAAVGAGRTDTFLGARYRRITRRQGKKKAIVAVGRSLLVIIWHVLAGPDTRFHELGSDHYDRHVNTTAKRRQHVPPTRSPRLPRHPRTRRLTRPPAPGISRLRSFSD